MESAAVNAIPYTAWEQAVFVVLFVVLVLGLLAWFSRQQGLWQKFIQGRDDQWQKFLREQREQDNAPILKLTAAVDKLVEKFESHDDAFRDHDAMERAKLDEMSKTIRDKNPTRPRGKMGD